MKTKIRSIKSILVIFVFLFIFLSFVWNKTYAAEDNTQYMNDLSGAYTIEYASTNFEEGYYMDMFEESPISEREPNIVLNKNTGIPLASQRFSFVPTKLIDGKIQAYEITSCVDKNGILYRTKDTENSYYIKFCNREQHKNDTDYSLNSQWVVATYDGGNTYKIMNPYFPIQIGIISDSDYGYYYCDTEQVISNNTTAWKINPVAGNLGIDTKIYRINDDLNYDITKGIEVNRIVEPFRDIYGNLFRSGRMSNIFNIGVKGENVRKTTYNNLNAFAVNYDSNFSLETQFVYRNDSYLKWQEGLSLGEYNNSDATLSKDSFEYNDKSSNKVGLGIFILETSYDNENWDAYCKAFGSDLEYDEWEIAGEKIEKGIYIRFSFAYEIKYKKGGSNAWLNVRETTDTFFVCADGFAEEEYNSLSPVMVNNLSLGNKNEFEFDDSYSIEEIKKYETLINNSVTTTGFSISSMISSYKIEVSRNDGDYIEVNSGYKQERNGKYNIKVTTRLGTVKEIVIYILHVDEITDFYFDNPFSNTLDDYSFVVGNRILSGDSDELAKNNVILKYSYAKVPVYELNSKITVERSNTLPSFKGKIKCVGSSYEEEYDLIYDGSKLSKTMSKPGYYTANIEVGAEAGDKIKINLEWWIVDDVANPTLNKKLIYNNSHETYDLIPVYYAVNVTGNRYTFKDENGSLVEKTQVISYAFADYDTALSFALRYEKEFATYSDSPENELFPYQYFDRYSGTNQTYNEYNLYRKMLENAKKNVVKSYFSNTKSITMQIFTPYDENGNVRKYDDGITETVAYCLEMNTNHCIVTTDKVELSKLTARQPYINNYKFISIPQDSSEVTLTDENGNEYDIQYGISVEKQLSSQEAETSIYTVTETNQYGEESSYSVCYIAKSTVCNTELILEINGKSKLYDKNDYGKVVKDVDYFKIKSATNKYDNHSLIIIKKDNKEIFYDISKLDENVEFNDPGEYSIVVEDRMGNNYEFKIIINEQPNDDTTI